MLLAGTILPKNTNIRLQIDQTSEYQITNLRKF
jgi:hypothetical protein